MCRNIGAVKLAGPHDPGVCALVTMPRVRFAPLESGDEPRLGAAEIIARIVLHPPLPRE